MTFWCSPLKFLIQNLSERLTHEQVDYEVKWTVDNKKPVHEWSEAKEPCRWHEALTFSIGLAYDELGHVDDEPGGVADEEHDNNPNENCGKINFIVGGAVSVAPNMSIPGRMF